MSGKGNARDLIPPEPVVILVLIGLMLTGALLYYRAVNLQRFLEPALAVLEPRTMLASRLNKLAGEELGHGYGSKILVRSSGLLVHKSLFAPTEYHKVPIIITRLGRLMHRLFEDPWLDANVEIIMVKTSVPINLPPETRTKAHEQMRQQSEAVVSAILGTNKDLAEGHADRFAATSVFSRQVENADWVTLDIIPSERLHIEVLERLGKYAHKPAPGNQP
jgi:hypothetical protein